MNKYLFITLMFAGYWEFYVHNWRVIEMDSALKIEFMEEDNSCSFNEWGISNLAGAYENFYHRLELETKEDINLCRLFKKRRSAWDSRKLKFVGSGYWDEDRTIIALRFDRKKGKIATTYNIEIFIDQIYMVEIKDQAKFAEIAATKKYEDEESNSLYIKELLDNFFLVKVE